MTRAFLYRIARNAWIDMQRKQKIKTAPFERQGEAAAPDPLLSSRELLEQLAERLAPKPAVILLLMDVFDFTAKEAAAFVRMKDSAVQVALGRARSRLKQLAREAAFEQTPQPSTAAANREGVGAPADLDALVDAFRRRDPHAIYRAYIGLAKEDIRPTRLRTAGAQLHFTFRDPDGNLFSVVSK